MKDALQGFSPVSVLSQLTVRFLFVRTGEFPEESSAIHRHHAYIEFLAGLLAAQPFPTGELREPTVTQCDEIWQRLEDYYTAVQRDLMADALDGTGKLHKLAFEAKNHSLMVRGEAYVHQLEQMAVGLYEEHDGWFQETLGFTIRGALLAAHAAMELSAWRLHQVLSKTASDSADKSARTEALTQYADAIIGFTVDELAMVSNLPSATCANVLKRLSQDFGYRNSQRPEAFTDPKQSPWDFNTLYEKPFIHHGGRYFSVCPAARADRIVQDFLVRSAG